MFCLWSMWIAFIPVHLIATDICFDHIILIMPNIGSMGDTVKAAQALPFKIYNSVLPSMAVVICISRKHIPALSPPSKLSVSSLGWGGVWAGLGGHMLTLRRDQIMVKPGKNQTQIGPRGLTKCRQFQKDHITGRGRQKVRKRSSMEN